MPRNAKVYVLLVRGKESVISREQRTFKEGAGEDEAITHVLQPPELDTSTPRPLAPRINE